MENNTQNMNEIKGGYTPQNTYFIPSNIKQDYIMH